jgi:preprotein translocase subunit SecD
MTLSRDPRVIIFVVSVLLALAVLVPVPTEQGLDSRLKYGLDLEGGSWLQLQLQGAIVELQCDSSEILAKQFQDAGYPVESVDLRGDSYVIMIDGKMPATIPEDIGYPGAKTASRGDSTKVTITAMPNYVIATYLENILDTDIRIVGVEPIRYEIRTAVTRESLNEILAEVGGSVAPGEDAFVEGVTEETVSETKEVLDKKLNRLGLQDIKVRVVDNRFILIDLAGVDVATAEDVVGKPGMFEIRVQTKGNESMHVLYGNDVIGVDLPRADRSGMVGVPFTLSEEGAEVLRNAAIDVGATKNPRLHELSMNLDKEVIFSAPLAYDLAASLEKVPMRNLIAEVGSGDEGFKRAKELYIHLREGALPVNVEIIGSGQVTAALGEQFKREVTIAGIMAILAVGLAVFYRYRERRIVLPMVATSFSEVIMMLGVWAVAGWQLDLASIAGIIAVIGTGVDHLMIITDELLYEGKLPSGKVYLARLSRAFYIIMAAAATTIFAMFPLLKMGFGALTGFALIIIIGVLIGVFIARPAYGRIIGEILRED